MCQVTLLYRLAMFKAPFGDSEQLTDLLESMDAFFEASSNDVEMLILMFCHLG